MPSMNMSRDAFVAKVERVLPRATIVLLRMGFKPVTSTMLTSRATCLPTKIARQLARKPMSQEKQGWERPNF